MSKAVALTAMLGVLTSCEPALSHPQDKTLDEVRALVKSAEGAGLVRTAKKTKPVDARPAKPAEVVVTVIAGEGKETQSAPAKPGDAIVQDPENPGDTYRVAAASFACSYEVLK